MSGVPSSQSQKGDNARAGWDAEVVKEGGQMAGISVTYRASSDNVEEPSSGVEAPLRAQKRLVALAGKVRSPRVAPLSEARDVNRKKLRSNRAK